MKSVLILGAGVAGCASAQVLKNQGFRVTVLEADSNPGGGVWTRFYGSHPYTFGPRVFFTHDEQVIAHLTNIVEMREFVTRTFTFVEEDSKLYNYPLQYSDIELMPDAQDIREELSACEQGEISVADFESYWMSVVGGTLYEKFVDKYSKKMWGIESNKQLSANFEWVNRGTPIRSGDTRLYKDQFQGYPRAVTGFNDYFLQCLDGVEARFNTRVARFDPDKRTVSTSDGNTVTADVIVNTVHVDSLFGNIYGDLRYCGRDFLPIWLPVEYAMPDEATWIHYSGRESHTRVTEFKKITGFKASSTLLGIEIPSARGRYYPVQSKPELERFAQYKALFPGDFYSIGRMGKFRYQGIPDAIRDALDLGEVLG